MTFAQKVQAFNSSLAFEGELPDGVRIMNPFQENPEILQISGLFYSKFYSDNLQRRMILGINPGRLGAGATGIPFTDSSRLHDACGIEIQSVSSHEPSSVFVYQLIEAYGGVKRFYRDFYINSVCPLGFLTKSEKGNWINCNYYDRPDLTEAVKQFCTERLGEQLGFGIDRSVCYIWGKKNARVFEPWNRELGLFGKLVALPHPRYVVQYRARHIEAHIQDFLTEMDT